MKSLEKLERTALDAVGERFSATWEEGGGRPDAYIAVAGKRVAVDIASLKPPSATGERKPPKLRLRFDKVATWLMEHVQAACRETVPAGTTVLLTVTAPIRVPSRTAAALQEKIQALFGRGSPGRDAVDTIHGNSIRIRALKHDTARAPKFIGFVHNPDSDAVLLLDMAGDLLQLIAAKARGRKAALSGTRWLVLTTSGDTSHLEAYRYICSELRVAAGFEEILMVFGKRRVERMTRRNSK